MVTNQPSSNVPKEPSRPSDEGLLNLNTEIEKALKSYLPADVAIRFDIPERNKPPAVPTVSVFLYDIQEDLELRSGQHLQYSPQDGRFAPGQVNVKCCYLITYWEGPSSDESPLSIGPKSQ